MSARRWPQLPPAGPSLRPSVRSTSSPPPPQPGRLGPAQRRPEQPRPSEETGAAPAQPCPAPALPVCPSVHPPARASVLLSGRQPPGPSPRSARFVSPWLAVSLSLPSRCLTAPPSLPDLGFPTVRPAHPSASLSELHSSGLPLKAPPRLWGPFLQHILHTPPALPVSFPHILWGPSLHLYPKSLWPCSS